MPRELWIFLITNLKEEFYKELTEITERGKQNAKHNPSLPLCEKGFHMHPKFEIADNYCSQVIGAAIEVHRLKGPGLIESIYEKCLSRELTLQGIPHVSQLQVPIEYKGHYFEEKLRVDLLVDNSLLLELKAVETILPIHKAQLLSYMKLLDVPVGLLLNFHELMMKDGIFRMILPNANKKYSTQS